MPRMMSGLELGQCVTSGWWVAWSYWVQCETRVESVCVVCQCKTLVHWQGEPGECVCVVCSSSREASGQSWSASGDQCDWWKLFHRFIQPAHKYLWTNWRWHQWEKKKDKQTLAHIWEQKTSKKQTWKNLDWIQFCPRKHSAHVWWSLVFPFLNLFLHLNFSTHYNTTFNVNSG